LQYLPNFGTTQNGALYELRTPAHLTSARGYLSGAKLKTPTASENVKPRPHRVDGDRYDLADQLGKLLSTPRSAMEQSRNNKVWVRPLDQPQNLENQIGRLILDNMNQPLDAGKQLWDE
jgi:hypothetical protein